MCCHADKHGSYANVAQEPGELERLTYERTKGRNARLIFDFIIVVSLLLLSCVLLRQR